MRNKRLEIALDFVRNGSTCKDAALIAGVSVSSVEKAVREAGLSVYRKHHDEIPLALYRLYKASAKARDLDFAVSIKDLASKYQAQSGLCALSGEPLIMRYCVQKKWHGNASLDRINSAKGYTKSNIQWVDTRLNRMKHQIGQNEFIDLCKKVANYNKGKKK